MPAKKKVAPAPQKSVEAEQAEAAQAQAAADEAAQAAIDKQAIADKEAAEAKAAADKAAQAAAPKGSRVAEGKAITVKGGKMLEGGDTVTAAMLAGGQEAFDILVKKKCIVK